MGQIEVQAMNRSTNLLDGKSSSRIHNDWACLMGQSYRLGDERFREEAMIFSMQMMARVRKWVIQTVEGLQQDGYQFIYPERILVEPDPAINDLIEEFREKGVHFSLALEAWLRVVGGVNLIGSHPSWSRRAYAYDDGVDQQEPMYTDPLVVELPCDYAKYLYDEWLGTRNSVESQAPFRLEIAPDHLHKANISGGLPYQLSTERPAVDGIVWNERHGISFVGYLREVIRWKGFPGLGYLGNEFKGWSNQEEFEPVI